MQSVVDQRPIRKPWRVATNSQGLVTILMHRQCRHHPSEHRKCGGRGTALTSSYPLMMSHAVHQGFEEQVRKDVELRLLDGHAHQRGSGDGCRQRHTPEPRSFRPVTMEGAWPRGQQSWGYQQRGQAGAAFLASQQQSAGQAGWAGHSSGASGVQQQQSASSDTFGVGESEEQAHRRRLNEEAWSRRRPEEMDEALRYTQQYGGGRCERHCRKG